MQHIDHVVLRVRDIERSAAFYCDHLGCEVVRRRDDLGLVHIRAGTSMIDLVAVDGAIGKMGGCAAATEGRNVDHICLRIEPFNQAYIFALVDAHDVSRSVDTQINFGAEGDGPAIYLVDPDGNTIELKGPVEPAQLAKTEAVIDRATIVKVKSALS